MEVAAEIGIGHHVVQSMLEGSCVPRLQTEDHKLQQKHVFSQLLEQYVVEGNDFLHSITIGDKSWLHHFDPETK
jgi:hypothetical protein